ncbi:MAG: Stp1/IreP family PP2C-type Ser/Thr phosphatase [Lewinellaceae bacterium]|nr:Stp1/IreP family PP2C-type Ser/Thr phosphatase [Lewinellaceae bacterium]HPQ99920.1 Stp1/IreP family PP2C-type Ser/Thr phosphatase [Saprospiraceae bacterium]
MFWRKNKKSSNPRSNESIDYRAIALTDQGNIRTNNEDQVLFFRPTDPAQRQSKGYLAIVADGMGGHAAGEVASALAVKLIKQHYYSAAMPPLEALSYAMTQANQSIFQEAERTEKRQGMGTTCTAVAILDQSLYLAHIGDSRAYLLHDNHLYQLTTDHTYIQDLLDAGKIDPMEAIHHPQRNVLTKALGTQAERKADVFRAELPIHPGDQLLLCTDGLYEYFTSEEMQQILTTNRLHEAAEKLIQEAKDRGGHDNVTVLLVATQEEKVITEYPTQFLNEQS